MRRAIAAATILMALAGVADAEPTDRSNYAKTVERLLLSNGVAFQVMNLAKPDASGMLERRGGFPRLVLFGYMNRADVYLLAEKLALLSGAKEAGFTSVEFIDKGENGRWLFGLAGKESRPACDLDKRLCF